VTTAVFFMNTKWIPKFKTPSVTGKPTELCSKDKADFETILVLLIVVRLAPVPLKRNKMIQVNATDKKDNHK
jgi:hypothetical protein